MKNRIISFVLAALMISALLSSLTLSSAFDSTEFSIIGGSGYNGDEIDMKVNVSHLTDTLVYAEFDILFDDTRFEYVDGSIANGTVNKLDTYDAVTVEKCDNLNGYSKIHVCEYSSENGDLNSNKVISGDGDIFKFKLKIKDNAVGTGDVYIDNNNSLFLKPSLNPITGFTTVKGTIDVKINAESVTLPESFSVTLGKESTLICDIMPNTCNESIFWSSSDPETVSVDGGVITGKKLGSAVITVTTESGLQDSCNVTVKKSMFPEPSITLVSDGDVVTTTVKLIIPGPYPIKWEAFSNDHFIYVTNDRKYKVFQTVDSASEVQELTVVLDPNQLEKGTYSGSITVRCEGSTEKLYVYLNLTQDVNYVNYWDDVLPESPYRINIAPLGEASASSYYNESNDKGEGNFDRPSNANDCNTNYWPRWVSEPGTWESPYSELETTIHWWMLDFKSPKTFDKFIMYGSDMDWSFPKEFVILGSNDKTLPDEKWHQIFYVQNTSQRYNTMDFEPVSFRYIKILFLESIQDRGYGNVARMAEFKVLSTKDYNKADIDAVRIANLGDIGLCDRSDLPEGFLGKNGLKWSVDNPGVLEINTKTGVWKANAEGDATVTASITEGENEISCTFKFKVIIYSYGDVNGDEKILITDALAIFKHISGKSPLTGYALKYADCNKDSKVNITDSLAIFKHIAGKELITQ